MIRFNDCDILISIIMPAYCAEKNIETSIRSVMNQTFRAWELIIIDDGSTDQTGIICDRLAMEDDRITVIHKSNQGVSSSRNEGIAVAKGKWIEFLDSDDALFPCTLERVATAIENEGMLIFGYESYPSEKLNKIDETRLYESYIDLGNDYDEITSKHLLNSPWNKLFLRDIIQKHNISFPKGISMGEDLLFNLQYISVCGKIKVISDVLYRYTESQAGSLSRVYRKNGYQIKKQIKIATDETFNHVPIIVKRTSESFITGTFQCIMATAYANSLTIKDRIQVIKECIEDPYFKEVLQTVSNTRKAMGAMNRFLIERNFSVILYAKVRMRYYLSNFFHKLFRKGI